MSVELKHKWRVPRRAWFIRLYIYAWSFYSVADREKSGVSERDINFCKLFWGYLLMPLAFLVIKPIFHFVDVLVWLARRVPRRTAVLDTGTGATMPGAGPAPPPPSKGPSAILGWVGDAFAHLILKVQGVWLRVRTPVLWLSFVLAGTVAAASLGVAGYLVATNLDAVVVGLGYGAAFVLAATILVLVGVALDRAGVWRAVGWKLRGGGRKAKHGTLGFVGVMRVGYRAVKTNTCPEIVLDDGDLELDPLGPR